MLLTKPRVAVVFILQSSRQRELKEKKKKLLE